MNAPNLTLTPELLQALGIDPSTIRDQVVDAIVNRAMGNYVTSGPDGEEGWARESDLSRHVHKQLEAIASRKFAEVITPIGAEVIENLTFPRTNTYGERKGTDQTIREWLDEKARNYLTERVDGYGKAQWEGGNHPSQPRIVYLIQEHLKYTIQSKVDAMMRTANEQIAGGIEAAVKDALADVLKKLTVAVRT